MSIFKDFNLRKKNLLITAKNRKGVKSSIMIHEFLENDDSNFVM